MIQDVQEYGFKGGNLNAADFGKSDANTFKNMRTSFDNSLKNTSHNYESQMAGVAENTWLLKDTKNLLTNPQTTIKR